MVGGRGQRNTLVSELGVKILQIGEVSLIGENYKKRNLNQNSSLCSNRGKHPQSGLSYTWWGSYYTWSHLYSLILIHLCVEQSVHSRLERWSQSFLFQSPPVDCLPIQLIMINRSCLFYNRNGSILALYQVWVHLEELMFLYFLDIACPCTESFYRILCWKIYIFCEFKGKAKS